MAQAGEGSAITVAEWDRLVEAGELVTAREAGRQLGVSQNTAYAMVRRGDLRAARHPSGRLYDGMRIYMASVRGLLAAVGV
jgi:excisionase family DNA binding protein